jgi:hypothetical protein
MEVKPPPETKANGGSESGCRGFEEKTTPHLIIKKLFKNHAWREEGAHEEEQVHPRVAFPRSAIC